MDLHCLFCGSELADIDKMIYQCSNVKCNEVFAFRIDNIKNLQITHLKTPFSDNCKEVYNVLSSRE